METRIGRLVNKLGPTVQECAQLESSSSTTDPLKTNYYNQGIAGKHEIQNIDTDHFRAFFKDLRTSGLGISVHELR